MATSSIPALTLVDTPVIPLTVKSRGTGYTICCIDNGQSAVTTTYVLSSANFAYNHQEFSAYGSPINRNALMFMASIESIDGVERVSVDAINNRIVVVYRDTRDRTKSEQKVLSAITLGAMGLGLWWVRVTRPRWVAAA